MIRRPPRSTLFPYTNALPIWAPLLELRRHPAADDHEVGPQQRLEVVEVLVDRRGPLPVGQALAVAHRGRRDRKSTRLNSSHANISYAVFCLKKKNHIIQTLML